MINSNTREVESFFLERDTLKIDQIDTADIYHVISSYIHLHILPVR